MANPSFQSLQMGDGGAQVSPTRAAHAQPHTAELPPALGSARCRKSCAGISNCKSIWEEKKGLNVSA